MDRNLLFHTFINKAIWCDRVILQGNFAIWWDYYPCQIHTVFRAPGEKQYDTKSVLSSYIEWVNLRYIKYTRNTYYSAFCFFLFKFLLPNNGFSFSLYKSGLLCGSTCLMAPTTYFWYIPYLPSENVDIVRRQWLPHFWHLSLLVSTEKPSSSS